MARNTYVTVGSHVTNMSLATLTLAIHVANVLQHSGWSTCYIARNTESGCSLTNHLNFNLIKAATTQQSINCLCTPCVKKQAKLFLL